MGDTRETVLRKSGCCVVLWRRSEALLESARRLEQCSESCTYWKDNRDATTNGFATVELGSFAHPEKLLSIFLPRSYSGTVEKDLDRFTAWKSGCDLLSVGVDCSLWS